MNGQWLRRFRNSYRRIFSITELEQSSALQWSLGAILFFFFLTFEKWIGLHGVSAENADNALCWPYFQGCGDWYVLQALPEGYSQGIFYMALYGVILAIIYCMWRGKWTHAHALLVPLFVWKALVIGLLNYTIAGPYDYYHLTFTLILLFAPLKEYFLKLAFVVLYFLSGTTKFDETWILGTYFSALQTGLPIFPDSLIPLFTNLVIFMQVVGAWFLLSKHPILQRTALMFFIAFHLYSGIFVNYHYPSVSLPLLIILFGMYYHYEPPPLTRKAILGWIFIALLVAFQLPPWFIEGDRRLTLEGNRYGMFMFEANHQCVATIRTYQTVSEKVVTSDWNQLSCSGQTCHVSRRVYEESGSKVTEDRLETGAAWNRCDPYVEWSRLQAICAKYPIDRIALQFDHSINGGPFYRIVDVPNICEIEYMPFTHNEWIKSPPEAPIVGYPIKDEYRY